MVWAEISSVLDATQNAVLITFGKAFDFIFGLEWALGGSELTWTAIGILVIVLLFA
ncbi:hypothetical protein J4220_00035 [Candidatus Micrarchaeota archaeon]|nr:hypothetical protein [Candidatus Micrarchaeota archaeon]